MTKLYRGTISYSRKEGGEFGREFLPSRLNRMDRERCAVCAKWMTSAWCAMSPIRWMKTSG